MDSNLFGGPVLADRPTDVCRRLKRHLIDMFHSGGTGSDV